MTGEQFSLLIIMVITVVYWTKTVIMGDRDNEHLFMSALIISGAATFLGYFVSFFTYKFIGEIIGGVLGVWFSDKDYKDRRSEDKEG